MRMTHPHPNLESARAGIGSFAIDVAHGDHATTVQVAGELDAASAPELGELLEVIGRHERSIELDLRRTTFIDSAGIRVLVRTVWDLQDSGSTLRLVAASAAAENVLRITGILDLLKDPTS